MSLTMSTLKFDATDLDRLNSNSRSIYVDRKIDKCQPKPISVNKLSKAVIIPIKLTIKLISPKAQTHHHTHDDEAKGAILTIKLTKSRTFYIR